MAINNPEVSIEFGRIQGLWAYESALSFGAGYQDKSIENLAGAAIKDAVQIELDMDNKDVLMIDTQVAINSLLEYLNAGLPSEAIEER